MHNKTQGTLIDVKWIDINKDDQNNPRYRSRLVGREFNDYKDDSLYASTPPLEARRLVLSYAATTNLQAEVEDPREVMVNDISRAYVYAPAVRALSMRLPWEDDEAQPGQVGMLHVCLYGIRDAARGWQQTLTAHLEGIGCEKGRGHPSRSYHSSALLHTATTACLQERGHHWIGSKTI